MIIYHHIRYVIISMYFKQGVFENFLLQERESVNDFLSEKESLDIEAAELQHCLSIRCWL